MDVIDELAVFTAFLVFGAAFVVFYNVSGFLGLLAFAPAGLYMLILYLFFPAKKKGDKK